MNQKTVIKSGFPVFTIAALVLLVLKLTGAQFSWWWIPIVWLFPLLLIIFMFFVVGGITLLFAAGMAKKMKSKMQEAQLKNTVDAIPDENNTYR